MYLRNRGLSPHKTLHTSASNIRAPPGEYVPFLGPADKSNNEDQNNICRRNIYRPKNALVVKLKAHFQQLSVELKVQLLNDGGQLT